MFKECKNTKQQGNIGLGVAIQYFTQNLYNVSLPLNDSQDYDLIVEDRDGTLKKVQVKTSSQLKRNNVYEIKLSVQGGNSKKNFIHKKANEVIYDWLFILCENGDRYLIPKENIKDLKSTITVGKMYLEYKI